MAKKDRNTLKNYFSTGSMPSANQFGDLIDSTMNIIDEGFDKTAEDGMKITPLGDSGRLISFYERIAEKSPIWNIRVDLDTRNLVFDSSDKKNVLNLSPEGRVGINRKNPEHELDVDGTICSHGRTGAENGHVPADGKWHDIVESVEGCHAFEIMAGAGKKKSGKYGLLHAFALTTFNARGKIKCHQAHYGSRCNQLKLRWKKGEGHSCSLQIRAKCCYGDDIMIGYNITKLWFDPFMEKTQPK